MTLYLIAANRVATLATDDPVVRAGDVGALRTAAETVAAAAELHDRSEAAVATATRAGHAEGREAGLAEGRAAAAAETRAHLFAMTLALSEERARARTDVSRLALEVVRRIAGEIGDGATVAALAAKATAALLPEEVATVRVAPDAAAEVQARLRQRPGLSVVADGAVGPLDCLIETPLGVSHASLDVQLAAVERAWAEAVTEAEVVDAA